MKHGYTNLTERRLGLVRKTFQGPDADLRQRAEHRALTALHGRYPVPEVTASEDGWIETAFVAGLHGQELLDRGKGATVLSECGRVLAQLHAIDPRLLEPSAKPPLVIQHGDFGPNNVLFEATTHEATAVLDWEFSGAGDPITDIAWCEWIVRMHHPDAVAYMGDFFAAYGWRPSWAQRQHEMLRRCVWLEAFARRWDPDGPAVGLWMERTDKVRAWRE